MMRATLDPRKQQIPQSTIELPFDEVTARAILIRRRDGAVLGVIHSHRTDGKYTLPGGHVHDGESADGALMRELEEEGIRLVDADERWREKLVVDYYHATQTLNLWYLIMVDDASVSGLSDEVQEARWLDQSQSVWYPTLHEKICLAIQDNLPDLLRVHVSVLESW